MANWWDDKFSDTGTDFTRTFDSGERYHGTVVETAFALYGLPDQGSPQLFKSNSKDFKIGRTDKIEANGSTAWPDITGQAPVENYFYGDFGLTLKKGNQDIDNLFAQLIYDNQANPGYSISLGPYGSMSGSFMQLGLSQADLDNSATLWFAMQGVDPDKTFPHSQRPTFSAELLQASLALSAAGQNPLSLSPLGVNLDTGTPGVTLHYNLRQEGPLLAPFSVLNSKNEPTALLSGVDLSLAAVDTANQLQSLLNFFTGDTYGLDKVYAFKRDKQSDPTYLNSGATIFQAYTVSFDLGGQRVGFTPRAAVPAPLPLLLPLGGSAWALRLRALRRRCRSAQPGTSGGCSPHCQ